MKLFLKIAAGASVIGLIAYLVKNFFDEDEKQPEIYY